MRAGVIATVCLSIVATSIADEARASIRRPTNVAAQDLAAALTSFARDRSLYLIYASQDIENRRTGGASGELTSDEALSQLLSGSGLTYRFIDDATVTIVPLALSPASTESQDGKEAQERSFWDRFRLAQMDQGKPSNARSVAGSEAAADANSTFILEEIIVSAQKRLERLQDVPVPVTAIDAGSLVNGNQLRLQDYYTSVPGLSVSPSFRGEARLAIRGVGADLSTNPTVGIAVDDVPYGASTAIGGGFTAPDIDPGELSRIEILRGPQGTLYGASSLGGLLKFVTVDPSIDKVSGRVQAGLSGVRNGDEAGYSFRGSINVPLGETIAIRASGFTRHDPGYIGDPTLGADGVNSTDADGGRLSALWRPFDALSVKLSALLQEISGNGTSLVHVQPDLGDLQHRELRGTGSFSRKTQAYSANLTLQLARAELTSLSGYGVDSFSASTDYSPLLDAAGALIDSRRNTKFTEELRFSIPLGAALDWRLGGFYAHEDSGHAEQDLVAVDAVTGATTGVLLEVPFPTTYEEYAAFTDLTIHVTDRLDVQLGARASRNEQTYSQVLRGPLVGGEFVSPEADSQDNAFTYLVTPRLELSPDMMVYARFASGYRPGGPNINTAPLGLPSQYYPDTTRNYELGIKGAMLDGALSFDASLYYIDWNDIQLVVRRNGLNFFTNGGRAKSQGIELAVESRPVSGLTMGAWFAWNAAELTESFASGSLVSGDSGDPLPYSSRFSGNVSLDQEIPLGANVNGFWGGTLSYVGERKGEFVSAGERQKFSPYAKADLRAGVRFDSWTVNLYANNVTDRRAALAGGTGTFLPYAFTFIQPRTIGMSLSKTF